MVTIEQQARAQLMMIENIYGIRLTNRDWIVRLIASRIDNERQVLTICTSLSSWILLNRRSGNVVIPEDVLLRLLETAQWQKEHSRYSFGHGSKVQFPIEGFSRIRAYPYDPRNPRSISRFFS